MAPRAFSFLFLGAWLAAACVTDLQVGSEQAPVITPVDASAGEDDAAEAPHDASVPQGCDEGVCGDATNVPGSTCADGSMAPLVCAPGAGGGCAWQAGACPQLDPCSQEDCLPPALLTPELDCGDATPLCARGADALCALVCPDEVVCGTASGQGCGEGAYCAFALGVCGAKDGTEPGGLCTSRPEACSDLLAPVCGCDGQTYDNRCKAALAGVNVAFAGPCSAAPVLCGSCAGEAPRTPAKGCGDGVHMGGQVCVAGPDGSCSYQWLECPRPGGCDEKLPPPEPGRCFQSGDCERGEVCEGASVCPCGAECFAPDSPGYCSKLVPPLMD